ncbi:hypothetical protein [Aureispira anguillae]|nr:hypothetical protein [Aureispira anguillae]
MMMYFTRWIDPEPLMYYWVEVEEKAMLSYYRSITHNFVPRKTKDRPIWLQLYQKKEKNSFAGIS